MSGAGWVVIGVPSSAGAHHAGQDLAPAALRQAGLIGVLRAAGVSVTDAGDLPGAVFEPDHAPADRGSGPLRGLAAVARVAGEVAGVVAGLLESGRRPLVLGGDCTITLGVVAGFRRVHPGVGLAYVDGDTDLSAALGGDSSGILDSAVIAHLLGHGPPELAGLAGSVPMLAPDHLALIGPDLRETSAAGQRFLAQSGVYVQEAPVLTADPVMAARRAITGLAAAGASPLVVHFDVDTVDSADLPLANFPHYGSGVTLSHATACLRTLLAAPAAGGLVLTEVNPTHDPGGSQLARYVDAVTSAIAGDAAMP
jgi:arginase